MKGGGCRTGIPGRCRTEFGSEKVSRYTGVSQLQLRVSRCTVQLRCDPLGPHSKPMAHFWPSPLSLKQEPRRKSLGKLFAQTLGWVLGGFFPLNNPHFNVGLHFLSPWVLPENYCKKYPCNFNTEMFVSEVGNPCPTLGLGKRKQNGIARGGFCTQSCLKVGQLLVNCSPTPNHMGSCRGLPCNSPLATPDHHTEKGPNSRLLFLSFQEQQLGRR